MPKNYFDVGETFTLVYQFRNTVMKLTTQDDEVPARPVADDHPDTA